MHYICSTFVPQLAHIICLSQENMPTAQGHNSGAIMYIICSDLLKKTSKHGLKIVVSLLLRQSFMFDVDSSAINTSCTRPISFSVQITFCVCHKLQITYEAIERCRPFEGTVNLCASLLHVLAVYLTRYRLVSIIEARH